MKLISHILPKISLVTVLSFGLISCEPDDDAGNFVKEAPMVPTHEVTVNFTQFVNGNPLTMNTRSYPYSNDKGQLYSVTKLQYLISDLTFHKSDGSSFTIEGYHYIDLDKPASLVYTPNIEVPEGEYSSISFTFGFDDEDNVDGRYQDLNTASWNWPGMLGGGYHFMRLEGDYVVNNDTSEYKTHMGTARDMNTNPATFVPNFFTATLPTSSVTINSDTSFDIEMNIEEWYKNPISWDFTMWNAPIMPIYDAQRALHSNGTDVFTVKF